MVRGEGLWEKLHDLLGERVSGTSRVLPLIRVFSLRVFQHQTRPTPLHGLINDTSRPGVLDSGVSRE